MVADLPEMELGKLVQFEQKGRSRKSGAVTRSGEAEILIFTGVRYERGLPTAPKPSAGNKRKRG